jgi:hypothetical protein
MCGTSGLIYGNRDVFDLSRSEPEALRRHPSFRAEVDPTLVDHVSVVIRHRPRRFRS